MLLLVVEMGSAGCSCGGSEWRRLQCVWCGGGWCWLWWR